MQDNIEKANTPDRDNLAAAAEYICLRLRPQELRPVYVQHLRLEWAAGDLPWDLLMKMVSVSWKQEEQRH
jgi:hypothetical protein